MKADVATDWNEVAQQAVLNSGNSPSVSSRALAIVQVSVFDAVNGIERRYQPIHVAPDAAPGASRRRHPSRLRRGQAFLERHHSSFAK